jgi:alpha-L-rhamnosidase
MKRLPVIVIFDIGKTNKKVLVFDEGYRVVHEHSTRLVEIADEDGFPSEDLEALNRFVFDTLELLFSNEGLDIRAVNFSAYGSGLVYIGADGKLVAPLYSYLKPFRAALKRQFFKAHGGESLLSKRSASKLEGSINAGLQLYRLKYERPAIFDRTRYALHLPQYLSYLLSGKACSEVTSIGCHTGLWDFEEKGYQPWVNREGIGDKLAPIVPARTVMPASFMGRAFGVGAGLHDSSAALIPYLTGGHHPFLLLSTGTWCVSLNPFAGGEISRAEIRRGALCYLTPEGQPVKASRLMLGKRLENGAPMAGIVAEQLESTRMVMAGSEIKQIFVDGGFSKNEEYMRGLQEGFSGIEVRAARLPHASALGAALMLKKVFLIFLLFLAVRDVSAQQTGVPGFSQASWITVPWAEDSLHPCPAFGRSFHLDKPIARATLWITAHGLYEARINGQRVGNGYFTPGWTSYNKRLQYQEYDVTKLVGQENEVAVTVADGWWRGIFGEDMQNNQYGKDAGLLFRLTLAYTDGSSEEINSDSGWEVTTGPVRYADFYQGEIIDHRIGNTGWNTVRVGDWPKGVLVPTAAPPVTRHERFPPRRIFVSPRGEQLIDFGQNLAGFVQIKVRGRAGDTIRIFHAEALDKDGNFYTGNLRDARAEDIYILQGGRTETFEPHFTYHGFRYIKIEGYSAPIQAKNFTAIALYSDLKKTGSFRCSDPLINQLQQNIVWSQKSNLMDIPTDCPQRSERLGWAGDAQMICRTAAFNWEVDSFFSKWLADLAVDQNNSGALPVTVPAMDRPNTYGVAGWGDAATIVPWALYQFYGDSLLLARQYPSMRAWVEYIRSVSPNLLWRNRGYGDWYAPGPKTRLPLIDECYFACSTSLLARSAKVLGRDSDYFLYTGLLSDIKTAFVKTYGDSLNTQTACVLALQFDLLPDTLQKKTVERLVELIHENDDHLATGFLGTPYLLFVLSENGYLDLAYRVLGQKTIPSWLYPVTKGATTIWEKWDAIRSDGSFDTCSLNHYAYGAVGQWLYETVAGIRAGAPGYKKIIIQPHPGGGLTWVKASYQCRYGRIVSAWKIKQHRLDMKVAIPAGTTATVCIPGKAPIDVKAGKYRFTARQ